MLIRIASRSAYDAPMLYAHRRFLVETLVECDIGAQKSSHILLKFPLDVFSCELFPLNAGKNLYYRFIVQSIDISCKNNFVEMYQMRPHFLGNLCLIETTRCHT